MLTVQQAEALKVAVKDAVSKAIEMMATGAVTPTAGAVATQVNKANPDLLPSLATSVFRLITRPHV